MSWATLHTPPATVPVRNPHHRAFPWPADAVPKLPDAPCYVMARDPRPWHRVMMVVGCCGAREIADIANELARDGWADVKGIYGRPRLRAGWLYVTREGAR